VFVAVQVVNLIAGGFIVAFGGDTEGQVCPADLGALASVEYSDRPSV
jgi:hypothetical protein